MRPNAPTYGNNDLTVVIPHFGSYDLLRQCLNTLSPSRLATVVVEDGCYDKGIRDEFPDVSFVTLSRNSGGAAGGLIDRYGYPFCRGRIFDEIERDVGQYDTPREIFWAGGAAFVARTGDIREAGGFDESLFAFHEELDLCWRLRASGKKIVFVPESRVFHVGSATWDSMAVRRAYLLHRNGIIVLVKNCPRSELVLVVGARYMLEIASAGYFFLAGRPDRAAAVLLALAWNIRRFRAMLRRYHRAEEQPVPQDLSPFIYPKSIAIARFLRGVNRFSELKW